MLPLNRGHPSEIFLIGEALASTQALATIVAHVTIVAVVHGPYPGQKATSGNFAYGLGGQLQNELGPCAQFSIYHLMQLETGEERLRSEEIPSGLFTQEVVMVGTSESSELALLPSYSAGNLKSIQNVKIGKNTDESGWKPRVSPRTLGDISKLLCSKNAGLFELTLDVMFDWEAEYELVKRSGLLSAPSVAKLFGISEEVIVWNGFFDQAMAYKVTIPRLRNGKPTASGGYMENDVHASQQYIGFMNLALPDELVKNWNTLQQELEKNNVKS